MSKERSKLNSSYYKKRIAQLETEIESLKRMGSDEEYFRARSAKTLLKRKNQLLNSKKLEYPSIPFLKFLSSPLSNITLNLFSA